MESHIARGAVLPSHWHQRDAVRTGPALDRYLTVLGRLHPLNNISSHSIHGRDSEGTSASCPCYARKAHPTHHAPHRSEGDPPSRLDLPPRTLLTNRRWRCHPRIRRGYARGAGAHSRGRRALARRDCITPVDADHSRARRSGEATGRAVDCQHQPRWDYKEVEVER